MDKHMRQEHSKEEQKQWKDSELKQQMKTAEKKTKKAKF